MVVVVVINLDDDDDDAKRMCFLCARDMERKMTTTTTTRHFFLFESKKKREMYLCAPPIHTDGDQDDDDDDDDDGFSLQRYFQTRARLVQKRYTATRCTLMKHCLIDDEKCSHFLCGTSDVVVVIFLSVLRIVDDFIPFHVGLIEMTRALETRSVVRALHVEY